MIALTDSLFKLATPYAPAGDQPEAIKQLVGYLQQPETQAVTLLGATGTGKTFTMANVIVQLQRPTLILAHNKTLAAQLYNEFTEFFPENAVEYFVSYYDFYQPEAYIPRTDTYIEKSSSINDDIDRMRHNATRSLFERRDTIVIASVSCIYGLGTPEMYLKAAVRFTVGQTYVRAELLAILTRIQYQRADEDFSRATFRVRGDVIDIHPANEEWVLRLSFFDEELESITQVHAETGEILRALEQYVLYPAVHHVTDEDTVDNALAQMKVELKEQCTAFRVEGKELEASRLEQRTLRDMAMIKELGYCTGIENYSRIFEGRAPGTPPKTLLDYFPNDFLLFVDESHVTIPQLRGMYHGDRSRKDSLVNYGFRLPAARDNRPLTFDETYRRLGQRLYVSATPSQYELEDSNQTIVEQIIRPTGLLDPIITVVPTAGQVDTLVQEIDATLTKNERVLITTLTKRMAEDLTEYLQNLNIKVRYLHSDIKPIERIEILRDLRLGQFDVLVGVNLLREGLDLPEVSLVCIMDADKEGFLRSDHALIQTIGRAARNAMGRVLLFADKITPSMQRAIDETERRRAKQEAYNTAHGIVPKTILKPISNGLLALLGVDVDALLTHEATAANSLEQLKTTEPETLQILITEVETEMKAAAKLMDFEKATILRDKLFQLKALVGTAG
jgi:excinuclease ABC subunit B